MTGCRSIGVVLAVGCLLSCAPTTLPPHAWARIGPAGGAFATDTVTVRIPAGALSSEVALFIEPLSTTPAGGFVAAELGPSGTTFNLPIQVTFSVADSIQFSDRLKVATFVDGKWIALTGAINDATDRLVAGNTTHFSTYGIITSNESCSNGVDDDGDGLIDCDDPVCAGDAACNPDSTDGGDPADAGAPPDDGGVDAGWICHNNNQCSSGEVCISGVCVLGTTNVSALDAGTPDAGLACQSATDCRGNEVCVSGVCTRATGDAGFWCQNDNQCATGEVCVSGACVAGSADAGALIDAGSGNAGTIDAGTGCRSNTQCAAGEVCSAGTCVPAPADAGSLACQTNSDCPSGLSCRGHVCK